MAALGLAVVVGGCGKKGPPLAPIVRVPARIDPFDVRRVGGTVYIQFTVPAANQDGTAPADLSSVEVWAFTGDPGPIANVYRLGTLVAAFPVRRPPPPETAEGPAPGTTAGPVRPRPPSPRRSASHEAPAPCRRRLSAAQSQLRNDQLSDGWLPAIH
jgi:hypothetical protein